MSLPSVFRSLRVTRSLVFSVMFCRSLFVLWSFFFWPLCCLFFCLFLLAIVLSVLLSFFWPMCCLFCLLLLGIVLSVLLRFTDSDYSSGIFQHSLLQFHGYIFLCTKNLYYYEACLFFKGFPEIRIYKRRLNRITNLTLTQC